MKRASFRQIIRLLIPPALLVLACVSAAGQDRAWGFSFGDSTGKNESCLACHGDAQTVEGASFIDRGRFAQTTHARFGCSSCHGAASKTHPGGVKMQRAECRECHAEIDHQYARSLHAGKTDCAGCHNPHKVQSPGEISGQEINRICSGCHETLEMTATHGQWLPQPELHLQMLPCITCHTGSKSYFISMYIVKGKNGSRFGRQELAGYDELKKMAAGGDIVALIDTNADNYVSIEELRVFNGNSSHKSLRLHGMLTPETVTHNFEILDSRRNCTFCHASGSGPMQTSFIALPEENGSFRRVPVEKGAVLDALYGTPDFYVMGSTKSSKLDGIGVAIICGGLIMPLGHGFLRFLTRNNRKGKEHKS